MLQRRQFLSRSAGLVLVPTLGLRSSDSGGAGLDSPTVEEITKRARALVDGRSVTLRLLLPQGSLANVLPVATDFEERTGVGVEFEEVPVDAINTHVMVRTASGEAAFDVALPATFGVPDLVETGCLRALDDYAAQHEPNDYQVESLYSLGDYYKGKLYGYQTDGDAYVMFYNRRLLEDEEENRRFEQLHGEPLKVPETWEELDRAMAFFHRPETGCYGGTMFRTPDYMAWEWWIRFHAKGFFPVDDDLRPQVATPAGVAALSEMIAASGSQCPGARTNGLVDNWGAFGQGTKFCNIGWGGTQKFLRGEESNMRDHLVVAPTPGGVIDGELVRVSYFNWGWNYTVSTLSPEPELAYLFALFACAPGPSTAAVRAQDGFFDPFRPAHYSDPEVREAYGDAFLEVHEASMRACIPDFYLRGQGEYFDVLRRYLSRADQGRMTPEEALGFVHQSWEAITDRLGRNGQIEQWRFLKSQYPEELRRRLS